jgi:hypothetical protein
MNPRHGCILALGIALLWSSAAGAANYVILFTARGAFSGSPSEQFVMDMEVVLDDIDPADVSGVGVEVDNGLTSLTLERFFAGSTEWEAEVEYADFNSMKAAFDGTWTITISGTAASTSTFTMDTATTMPELQDSDYFPVPTNLVPAEGATNVTLDTNFSWTDPTGGATPDLVEVEVGTEFSFSEQSDIFPFETLQVDAESWDPPLTLFPGQSFFFVFYADVDATRVTPLTTTSGTITWGLPPEAAFFSPPYPAMTPIELLGSFSEIQFDTERLLEDFEAYAQPQEDVAGPDFLITTNGNPSTDPAVVEVAEGLAERAGIELDATNQVAFAGSGSGTPPGSEGFLLIADIPALGGNRAGPFADFFANPTGFGREFFNVTVRAVVRESTGAAATQVRFLIADDLDNEAATNKIPLTTAFDTFEAQSFDFFDLDLPTNFSQITGVAIEFFAETPGPVPQLRFQFDDVEITAAPEPSSSALGLSALTALALLARVRRKRGVGKP